MQATAVPEGVQLHVASLIDREAMEKLFEKIKPGLSYKCANVWMCAAISISGTRYTFL